MTVHDLKSWLAEHKETLIASLLDGRYQPQPIRGIAIPKPGGGVRQLGILTVVEAMPLAWFRSRGLLSLSDRYTAMQRA